MATHITGFDIGDRTLKMAVFANGQFKQTVSAEVPENMVSGGQVISAEGMSEFIAEVAANNNLTKKQAALLLPASLVFVRTIVVPVMTEHQLKYNLPYEFKDYLNEDKSKYIFDYEVLDVIKDENGKPKELKLFVCAVLKDVIDRYKMIFLRAGYDLKIAVPEEYLFAKIVRDGISSGRVNPGACAVLDLGQSETRMHLLLDGAYDNKRTFDLGIANIENIVSDISFADIHIARNMILNNSDNILSNDKCKNYYNALAVEILKAANFYNYNNRDYELKDMYLIGGGSSIEPMVDVIKEVTGLTVHSASELISDKYPAPDPWNSLLAVYSAVQD